MPDIVFISWSKSPSHEIAQALKTWVEGMLQSVEVFLSSNIEKGSEWGVQLKEGLNKACYGILCVTPRNVQEPWILFEAGALYLKFEKARCAPLLFGLPAGGLGLPLIQLQAAAFSEDEMLKVAKAINRVTTTPTAEDRIERQAKLLWPMLKDDVDRILAAHDLSPDAPRVDAGPQEIFDLLSRQNEMVQEIFRTVTQDPRRLAVAPSVLFGMSTERRVSPFTRLTNPRDVTTDELNALLEAVQANLGAARSQQDPFDGGYLARADLLMKRATKMIAALEPLTGVKTLLPEAAGVDTAIAKYYELTQLLAELKEVAQQPDGRDQPKQ